MRENNAVTLRVNGELFSWWQNVRISASLTSVVRTFSVGLTRDLALAEALPVKAGDEVEVLIGEDLVLSGYVTKVSVAFDAKTVGIVVSGASYTVDLVESCLPIESPHLFKKEKVGNVLNSIASCFGIDVVEEVALDERVDVNISPVETVQSVIKRLIKSCSFLVCDSPSGGLVITRPVGGRAEDILQTGLNVLSGTREVDWSKVYSSYVVIGESPNPGSESTPADHQKSVSADDWEVRTRVLVTAMDDSPTIATMTKRAMILKDFSKGSSEKLVYTVQGWRQSNGELWQVNRLTQVKDGITDVFGEYLITAVTYELGPQGTTTRLELMHPHALLNTEFKSSKDAVKKSLGFKKKGKTENADWTTT